MAKRFCCVLLCGFLCMVSVFAQIKSYVGIVRGSYYPENVKFLTQYRDELTKDGYTTYASVIDDYLKGGFGSGFVYVDSDGKNYVITCRHVISSLKNCSIEFEKADGTFTKYDNLSIVHSDEELDIAILSFPENIKPFKVGLSFLQSEVYDGADVWSAGFPGVGNDPVWQLGKGTVTNASVKRKELINPEISTLIQHSAQVDPGNSGGPLMVASKNSVAGYKVIGLNTWKYVDRQDTNYALPSITIQNYLNEKLHSAKAIDQENELKERVKSLTLCLNDSEKKFTDIVKYVSYEYAAAQGKDEFENILATAPSSVRSVVIRAFGYSPLEGLRYALAYKVWKSLHAQKNSKNGVESSEIKLTKTSKTSLYDIDFSLDDSSYKTSWALDQGLWRLSSFSSERSLKKNGGKSKTVKDNETEARNKSSSKKNKSSSKGLSMDNDCNNRFLVASCGFPLNGFITPDVSLSFFNFSRWSSNISILGWGVSAGINTVKFEKENREEMFNSRTNLNLKLVSMGLNVGFRLPLASNHISIVPFANITGGWAFCIDDVKLLLNLKGEAGCYFGIPTNSAIGFLLGASYKYNYFVDTLHEIKNKGLNEIAVSAVMTF